MIHDPSCGGDEIAEHLDALDPSDRWRSVEWLTWHDQRTLYELTSTAEPLGLEHFVPAEVADGGEVVHRGRNSLPLPRLFRFFEKRFARPYEGRRDRLFGFNAGASRPIIGPGYFVTIETAHRDGWVHRGGVVIDYFQVPDGRVPAAWPRVVPNSRGLQTLVYRGTRDFMRRVSEHVSVGAAYKGELKIEQFFVLVRQPAR